MLASIDEWKLPEKVNSDSVEIIFSDGRRINVYENRIEAYVEETDEEIITTI